MATSLRIAFFGQGPLAAGALSRVHAAGHNIVVVYAPPVSPAPGAREDPLVAAAGDLGLTVVRRRYFRKKTGEAIPAAVEEYAKFDVELNLLAVVTVFIPDEITSAPAHGSLCFHPSLLPRFRGGSAVNWQIMEGEKESGVTVFVPDAGADTGPIVLQRGGVDIAPNETTGTLFFSKLMPLGIDVIAEAVELVAEGKAKPAVQDEGTASHQDLLRGALAAVDLARPGADVWRHVRACDPQPGAYVMHGDQKLLLFDSAFEEGEQAEAAGTVVSDAPHSDGLRIAVAGGTLTLARVRGDGAKESAEAYCTRAGLKRGVRLTSAPAS
jgi:methionyl-tRNA formyltransferase